MLLVEKPFFKDLIKKEMNKPQILIIEDHPDIVEIVDYHFRKAGFKLQVATNGREGLKKAESSLPSLILLDLMLPGLDGMEICRRLRHQSETQKIPIIMLTAKGSEEDIVRGLEMGADDYVTKPFQPKELIARVQAMLRRTDSQATSPSGSEGIIEVDDLQVDVGRHEVYVGLTPIKLTLTEFRLLQTLLSGIGRIFTRDQLIDKLRGGEVAIVDRNIDVHVSSLRKKLKEYGSRIYTVRGVGYRFLEK